VTTQRGNIAETLAETYLQAQGLRSLERNFRCRVGEIDLIMLDDDTLAFVEVRYRKSATFGHPIETITRNKRSRIVKCASYYLNCHRNQQQRPCRFDVVALTGELDSATIEWIRGAFQA
jgi:putative endonuclease